MSIHKTRSVWLTTLCAIAIAGGIVYSGVKKLASADEIVKEEMTLQQLDESVKDAMVREAVEKAVREADAEKDTAE